MGREARVLFWAIVVGAVAFAAGFFGPIVFAPDANQGPLLGIFITGPAGFVAGALYGIWREWRRPPGAPSAAVPGAPAAPPADRPLLQQPIPRGIVIACGVLLGANGFASLDEGRGAAAMIAIAAALIYTGVRGALPYWFRR